MRRRTIGRALATSFVAVLAAPRLALADPYALRVDAVGYTQSTQPPVGLLVVQGEDRANRWVDAEALAWTGNVNGNADVLTALVRLHDPKNYGQLRLGRQIITIAAMRPIHLDGADVRARAPIGTSIEAFGGVPVVPQFAYKPWDWVVGGRLAQAVGRDTSFGVSYAQQRADGFPSYEAAGVDFASAPVRWFDVAAHGAYDLINPGLAEAGISVAGRFGDVRPEIYATDRSPSRLIPATSLFSALGDTPSQVVGAAVKWRMFPRLDVLPMVGARWTSASGVTGADVTGDTVGVDGTLRVTLRLDDNGDGAVSAEGRRQGSGPDPWSGIRVTTRVPLAAHLRSTAEVELVAPDDPRGRGSLWPWALIAMRWSPIEHWEVAGAVEAASTPTATREVNALLRLSWSSGRRR